MCASPVQGPVRQLCTAGPTSHQCQPGCSERTCGTVKKLPQDFAPTHAIGFGEGREAGRAPMHQVWLVRMRAIASTATARSSILPSIVREQLVMLDSGTGELRRGPTLGTVKRRRHVMHSDAPQQGRGDVALTVGAQGPRGNTRLRGIPRCQFGVATGGG